jgi:hypothetical protein
VACTSSTEADVESDSDSHVQPEFALSIQGIMSLPLSDEQKAEAIRRLLCTPQSQSWLSDPSELRYRHAITSQAEHDSQDAGDQAQN